HRLGGRRVAAGDEDLQLLLHQPLELAGVQVIPLAGAAVLDVEVALDEAAAHPEGTPRTVPARASRQGREARALAGDLLQLPLVEPQALTDGARVELDVADEDELGLGSAGCARRSGHGPTLANPSPPQRTPPRAVRSEEHTSELQSRENLVCRLLLE